MARTMKGSKVKRDCMFMITPGLVGLDGTGDVAREEEGCNKEDEKRLAEHGRFL